MPQQVCFMIMPYGRKPTQASPGGGVPGEIDFNALWDRAFAPTINRLGYQPVRADQDTGALIVNQMIERLYFADLVLADMTIPNGNVYYEIGIRHAAKKDGCVLLAADWSRRLFDVAQMRTLTYPLPEGDITEPTAKAIGATIEDKIEALKSGVSPMHETIRGYPDKVDEASASIMREAMAAMAEFQGKVRAVRAFPHARRMAGAKELVARYWKPPVTPPTALGLLLLMKDSAEDVDDWSWIMDFIRRLPEEVAKQDKVGELNAFALAKAGKPVDAIAGLETLIEASGPTPERLGMLGGRYKQLLADAGTPADEARLLRMTIDAYERGMELDLNQYYCSCNLPRLYRRRRQRGDAERAQSASKIVLAACERAKKLGLADEWLRPTLLGAAFDAGDADKAEELAAEVAAEGAARWKLDATLADLEMSVAQIDDGERKARLTAILGDLKQLSAG